MNGQAEIIVSALKSSKAEDLSHDPRLGFVWVVERYGIRTLERLKRAWGWVPRNLSENSRIEALQRYSGLSELVTKSLVADICKAAPHYLEDFEALSIQRRQLLMTSQQFCRNGCFYKEGNNRGTPRILQWHREPLPVTVYLHTGEHFHAEHLILRCRGCESRYSYATWTDPSSGFYSFYPEKRDLIMVTRKVFVSRVLAEHLQNFILFAHCSFEAYALAMQRTYKWPPQFSAKIVASAHRKHQIQEDLWENGQEKYQFSSGKPITQCIPVVLKRVFSSISNHECMDACAAKGCGRLAVVDGMWKIGARHCAAQVVNIVNGFPLINYPGVCTEQTAGNSIYCENHDHLEKIPAFGRSVQRSLTELQIPGLRSAFHKSAKDLDSLLAGESDPNDAECPNFDPNEMCRKNKGEGERGITYSRGYVFVVRGSGIIDCFAPIYRAESLGQVFLILISWLYQRLQNVPKEEWGDLFLAYDNMCQLDRLRATKKPLPLPAPYDSMWSCITKIIDGLHISNHKNPNCRRLYGPDKFKEKYGDQFDQNTMAAEQTFSWLVKHKKQLNSMRKELQEFHLHRLRVGRNRYIEDSMKSGNRVIGSTRRGFIERKK